METVLGLDIGTNSIGWCLLEKDKKIIDLGVRIFPVGVKEDDYNKSGTEISRNAARRNARGIRRLYSRYKLRRKLLIKILRELDMMPPESLHLSAFQLYGLRKRALEEQLSLKEIGRIFLLLNQRRGFKSNKKSDTKPSASAKELSEMKQKMNELAQKVEAANCRTVGEYFYSLFLKQVEKENWHNPDEPVERIRNRFVYRKLYEQEFDFIWEKQCEYYPKILNDKNKNRIKDQCIYYQRPLKSQKHLVSKCRFEPSKRVAPKCSFEFQEFRIWQTISNIRITGGNRFRGTLTLEEKLKLAEKLNRVTELSKSKMKETLSLPKSYSFQKEMSEKIKGNITNAKIGAALGDSYYDALSYGEKYKLLHTLMFANDEEWLENYSYTKFKLNKEQVKNYLDINLEPGYCNLSTKAINKILPFMKQGLDYAQACASAGYHHSYDEETDGRERELKNKIETNLQDEIRNPLVRQAISETNRLVNEIIAEYGRPSEIRVELARQLQLPKDRREKLFRKLKDKEEKRETYKEFIRTRLKMADISKADIIKFELWLEMEFAEKDLNKIADVVDLAEFKKFAKNVKPSDALKYNLWLECGRICPYTGKTISISKLLSPDIEVEHIIPYSKSMDDSFANKTLSEKEFNAIKGNKTPFEYFSENQERFEEFKTRIKNFSSSKQRRFLLSEIPSDFLNQQLNNTAYISLEVRKNLKTICRNVRITNGQATSNLRRFWGLNQILNPDGDNEKCRYDHRHHAIDALVIANTTDRFIHMLSSASKFDYTGRMSIRSFPFPYDNFISESKLFINKTLISYKNKKRLLTTRTNKYDKISCKSQKSISIRGPLHEETFYGKILNPHTNEESFVVRKKLSDLDKMKQVSRIIDPKIRKIITDHILTNGGESKIKQALSIPLFMISKDGKKKIPINKVRIAEPSESLIQIRPLLNPKLYVSSGSNYLIAIYEDEGRRAYETVSFYQAAINKLNGHSLYPMIKDSLPFSFYLMQKDMMITYDEHPDELDFNDLELINKKLYRVLQFDKNGIIILGQHNISKISATRDPKPYVIRCNYNTLKAVKVRISLLGKLILNK